jgi:hypothetical protein
MAKEKSYTRRTVEEVGTSGTVKESVSAHNNVPLLFNKENYKWIAVGFGLMLVGFMLMSGGKMTDPNVWDANTIYSFRRITLAPIVILAGLIVQIYAIFYKK